MPPRLLLPIEAMTEDSVTILRCALAATCSMKTSAILSGASVLTWKVCSQSS